MNQPAQVRKKVIIDGRLNPDIVGQSIPNLSKIFGITTPPGTKVIIGEVEGIGHNEALSEEKLCPVLAFYKVTAAALLASKPWGGVDAVLQDECCTH